MRCLSFDQRAAFVLHVLAGLPIREVADALERSEGATKALIFRAREALRDFLCRICSDYDPTNPCRCENLAAFSLRNGWVGLPTAGQQQGGAPVSTEAIQQELDGIRRTVAMFQTLPEAVPSELLLERIRRMVGHDV